MVDAKNDAKRAVNGDWREELKDWADIENGNR